MPKANERSDKHFNSEGFWQDERGVPLEGGGSVRVGGSFFKTPNPGSWEVGHNKIPLTLTFYGPKGGVTAIFFLTEKDAAAFAAALVRATGLVKRVKGVRRGHRAKAGEQLPESPATDGSIAVESPENAEA